jgi:cytochrome b
MRPQSTWVPVWDLPVRVFHWALVLCVSVDLIFAAGTRLHVLAGFGVLGLISFRLIWGLLGSRYARFASFIYGPRAVSGYLIALRARRPLRYLGHNPLGGWMIIAMLIVLAVASGTGALIETARFAHSHKIKELHENAASLLYFLVPLHVFGVVASSIAHRENLVEAMITGRKRARAEAPAD